MNKKVLNVSKITGIINLLISVFVFVAINTFLHPCSGEEAMSCNYSTIAATLILILIALLGISKVIASENKSLLLLDVVTLASAVELLLIPKLIGRCGMAAMVCNTRTMPALTISALLLILISIISIIGNVLKSRRKGQ